MSSRNTSCERYIALIIGLGLGGCAGLDNSVEFAKSGAPGIYCGPAMVVCIPVLGALGVAARPAASPEASHRADRFDRENSSFSGDTTGTTRAAAQSGVLTVGKRSIGVDASGLVTATLLIDLDVPGKNQERSYEIDVGVDCADGELETYRIRSYKYKGGWGKLHTQYAGLVKRSRPGPPLDTVVRAVCDETGKAGKQP